VCAVGFLFLCHLALPFLATFALGILAMGIAVPVYLWDSERRTARIIYDVDDPRILERLAMCNAAAEWLAHSGRLWHIYYSAATTDWKTNAGASTLIQRTATRTMPTALPRIELNIGVYSIPFGPQHLLFLPDRLIVQQGARFAGVPYEYLYVESRTTRFIEDGTPPHDAQVLDTTWRFVNKSGGPDRRFNNNTQLPICKYGELELSTTAGMRVVLQTSNPESAVRAAQLLSQLCSGPSETTHPSSTAAAPQPEPTEFSSPQPAPPSTFGAIQPATSEGPVQVHRAMATLLRFVAAADRKIDDAEVAAVVGFLSTLGATDLGESGDLSQQFRSLRSDEETAEKAANVLLQRASHIVPYIVEAANTLAQVDGRVTPKERERLDWLNYKLGSARP
jgi:hypothetical protein